LSLSKELGNEASNVPTTIFSHAVEKGYIHHEHSIFSLNKWPQIKDTKKLLPQTQAYIFPETQQKFNFALLFEIVEICFLPKLKMKY